MKRINIFLRISALMLIAILASSGVFVGSSTYAKYIASAEVTATANVALFKVLIGTQDITVNGGTTYTGALALTKSEVYEQDGATLESHAGDLHLDPHAGTIVCPGTSGKCSFTITNSSQVMVEFRLTQGTTPAAFGMANIGFGTTAANATNKGTAGIATMFTNWNTAYGTTGNTAGWRKLAINETYTVDNLWWKWQFYESAANDGTDTTAGKAAGQAYAIPVKVEVQQVD